MIITNVEIAKVIEKKGYDFQKALDSIDAGRTPDQETKEVSIEEIDDMIKNICLAFEIEREEIMH